MHRRPLFFLFACSHRERTTKQKRCKCLHAAIVREQINKTKKMKKFCKAKTKWLNHLNFKAGRAHSREQFFLYELVSYFFFAVATFTTPSSALGAKICGAEVMPYRLHVNYHVRSVCKARRRDVLPRRRRSWRRPSGSKNIFVSSRP